MVSPIEAGVENMYVLYIHYSAVGLPPPLHGKARFTVAMFDLCKKLKMIVEIP